jgi:Flp pilus assembly protein TadB
VRGELLGWLAAAALALVAGAAVSWLLHVSSAQADELARLRSREQLYRQIILRQQDVCERVADVNRDCEQRLGAAVGRMARRNSLEMHGAVQKVSAAQ